MKQKRSNKAVSEVVGTAILLGMAVALFSMVQIMAMSFPFNPHPPSARLVAYIDEDWVNIAHHGGEPLSSDTKILITIDEDSYVYNIVDLLSTSTSSDGDDLWEIGEVIGNNYGDLSDSTVNVIVVDILSNEIIMMSTLQE